MQNFQELPFNCSTFKQKKENTLIKRKKRSLKPMSKYVNTKYKLKIKINQMEKSKEKVWSTIADHIDRFNTIAYMISVFVYDIHTYILITTNGSFTNLD